MARAIRELDPSIQRMYEIWDERERERIEKRRRLSQATSLYDFHEIKHADAASPPQEAANVGYAHLKRKR